jgi:hypothetical protein
MTANLNGFPRQNTNDKTRLDPGFESSIFASCRRQIAGLSPDREAERWGLPLAPKGDRIP